MKSDRKLGSYAIGSSLFLALGLTAAQGRAGTITVNTAAMVSAQDGKCSLVEALQALNQKSIINECNPGSGAVTILLATNVGPYVISADVQTLAIRQPVTLGSATANTKVTIRMDADTFSSQGVLVSPDNPNTTVTLQDLRLDGSLNSFFMNGIFALGLGGNTLVLNRCDVGFWAGGGILADGYTLNVKNSYIHANGAGTPYAGGGIQVGDWEAAKGVFNISNTTLFSNSATFGGAIYAGGTGHSTIVNSSILSNQADEVGSAIVTDSAAAIVDFTASTIAWNRAGKSGAGQGPGAVNLTETILANNYVSLATADYLSDWDRNSRIASFKDSLIDSTTSYGIDSSGGLASGPIVISSSSGTNVKNTVPGTLVVVDVGYAIPDLGGPTLNNVPMSFLAAGSPAIDVLTASTQTKDQRGYPRGVGGKFDIGSFEFNPNAEAESMIPVGAPLNGAISSVSNVPNFTPAGTGIKFTPSAGLTSNASFAVRVPLILGAGDNLRVSTQLGPNAGNYQVAFRKEGQTAFTNSGVTMSLYRSSPLQTTIEIPVPASVDEQGYATMDVQFILVGKDRRSMNNFLYLDSATFH